ncbi:MAG: 50S ribosomal protein L35 [Actinobacteria bacterium]|nr:50S ribosomal protein L35 [Actinomycetota bacterium]
MTKLKTHKATVKRIAITKTNKIKQRKAGQDHFNARESGNTKRQKRRDISANNVYRKTLKQLMPYN